MRFEHDALVAVLVPGSSPGARLAGVAAVLGVFFLSGVATVWLGSIVVPAVTLAGVAAVLGALALKRVLWQRTLELRVDARWLVIGTRRVSLLDLQRAHADGRGFLVLETQPGPLADLWIPARNTPHLELVEIAAAITEAIARASHRGDAPDERTRAVQQLLSERS